MNAPSTDPRPSSRWLWVNLPALAVIGAYRLCLAPLMSGHCRFQPTCSRYAWEAFCTLNPLRAAWLSARRIGRCHPWGGSGYDPVPTPGERPRTESASAHRTGV